MSASVVALFFLLSSACVLFFLEQSRDPRFFHKTIVPMVLVSLIMLIFGSWKIIKATKAKGRRHETDSELDYEVRENQRKLEFRVSTVALLLSIIAFLVLLAHAKWGWAQIQISQLAYSVVAAMVVAIFVVNRIKAYSDLHGHQVSFRLGLIVVVTSVALVIAAIYQDSIRVEWSNLIPFPYAGTSMIAFALGLILWVPLNQLFPYEAAVGRLVENSDVDGLESFFYYAMTTFQQVQVTLGDDKVYVGYVDREVPIAGLADNYVQIIPTASGYRDNEDRQLHLTTFYLEPFQKAIEDDVELSSIDLAKIVPIEHIRSAGIFNPKLYAMFQNDNTEEKSTNGNYSYMRSKLRRLSRLR